MQAIPSLNLSKTVNKPTIQDIIEIIFRSWYMADDMERFSKRLTQSRASNRKSQHLSSILPNGRKLLTHKSALSNGKMIFRILIIVIMTGGCLSIELIYMPKNDFSSKDEYSRVFQVSNSKPDDNAEITAKSIIIISTLQELLSHNPYLKYALY